MDFKAVQKRTHDDAKSLGWYDNGKTKSDVESLMLVVSELSEAVEELRGDKPNVYFNAPSAKPEGFGVEVADAVIRLLDLAEFKGINLEEIILQKLDYNLTRGYRHGNKKY